MCWASRPFIGEGDRELALEQPPQEASGEAGCAIEIPASGCDGTELRSVWLAPPCGDNGRWADTDAGTGAAAELMWLGVMDRGGHGDAEVPAARR
mmetsp:Transcript_3761/g.11947  ORF Transcript_3761/g.11947 Transcript_3761/m.11947 type:complete len:95 (-) Transcript_3761:1921-2205(-)